MLTILTMLNTEQLAVFLKELADDTGDQRPVLWQVIRKEHIAADASDEEWERFVDDYDDGFAEHTSDVASGWWADREAHYPDDTNHG